MKKFTKSFILIVMAMVFTASANAQVYKYHSLFLYTFTKYIEWPTSYQNGDFVIGVVGSSPITEFLDELAATKTVGTQRIVVKKFNSSTDISKCHMLFVPTAKSADLESILGKLSGQSTLVITEKAGLGKKGSGINFVLVDGKVKFELNKAATEKSNLKVSNDLAKLAIEV